MATWYDVDMGTRKQATRKRASRKRQGYGVGRVVATGYGFVTTHEKLKKRSPKKHSKRR
jgi:hypothetical protein